LVTVRLRAEINRVAPFATSVLITGPTGTGKELVARHIHDLSPRAAQPFIPVDCASINGELMSSQLFGHIAGAFTGASHAALGCFRAANGGTLFLDEVGELEYPLQAKLLRVLQEHIVIPVGSHHGAAIDVRVIAATNRDLETEVTAGRFREDLYYRLHVAHIRTAKLSERTEDIPVLARGFLAKLADEGLPRCSLSQESVFLLQGYDWPGNVRQLRNVLEQAAIDSDSPVISCGLLQQIIPHSFVCADRSEDALPPYRSDRGIGAGRIVIESQSAAEPCIGDQETNRLTSEWPMLQQIERQHIAHTLEHTFYNRTAAAKLLGITRQSLLRKMKRYEITPPTKLN
jgi:DNA-binding NtrC family response regulator